MPDLSPAGSALVDSVARKYGLPNDAVLHMLLAVYRGNGSMAQFSHPAFGGSGQWMRGGMTMVSDLFNTQLKMLVENVCNDLSSAVASNQSAPFSGSFQSQSQSGSGNQSQAAGGLGIANSLFVPDPQSEWWPKDLGVPAAVGAQNNVRYAYFPASRRLAVSTGGAPWIYDTLDHQIGGFGQQQGGGSSITFTSQHGTVALATLPVVVRDGVAVPPVQPMQPASMPAPAPLAAASEPGDAMAPTAQGDILGTLERLGQLRDKGYVTSQEFEAKKAELLKRL